MLRADCYFGQFGEDIENNDRKGRIRNQISEIKFGAVSRDEIREQ